jgi:hypothetical protein
MNKRKSSGQFVKRSLAMLESPAFRALSLTGHRILACIEIEHCAHGGKDNGALPVTHADFKRFGIHHNAVGPGIREAVALGFTEISRHGVAGNAEYRRPTLFRQTYLPAFGKEATNEWTAIETIKEATIIAAKARAATPEQYRFLAPKSKRPLGTGKRRNQYRKPVPRDGDFQYRKPVQKARNPRYRKPVLLSRYLSISSERSENPPRLAGPMPKLPWSTPAVTEGSAVLSPGALVDADWNPSPLRKTTSPGADIRHPASGDGP